MTTELLDAVTSGTMTGKYLTYLQETVTKQPRIRRHKDKHPSSLMTFDKRTDEVKKVAAVVPISESMLNDEQAVKTYINTRMPTLMRQAEVGYVLDVIRKEVPSKKIHGRIRAAVRRAVKRIQKQGLVEPDFILVDRKLSKRLEKIAAGGLVVQGASLRPGEIIVGDFGTGVGLWRKGDSVTDASNSHKDFFKQNLVAIRTEQRELAVVYRPQAFQVLQTRTWPHRLAQKIKSAVKFGHHGSII